MTRPPSQPGRPPLPENDLSGSPILILMIQVLTSDCQCSPCRVIRDMAHRLGRIGDSLLSPPAQDGKTPAPNTPQEAPAP